MICYHNCVMLVIFNCTKKQLFLRPFYVPATSYIDKESNLQYIFTLFMCPQNTVSLTVIIDAGVL